MLLDLLQRGLRTVYRTLGAREIRHHGEEATLHGFAWDGNVDHTLVLLHGLGDASTTWYRMITQLRGSCRILAFDLPPFGLSELKRDTFLMPEQQALTLLPALRENLEGEVTVLGTSMGGWVTQWLLHHAPDLADNAVLVSPAGARLEELRDARTFMAPATREDVLDLWDRMWYKRPAAAGLMAGSSIARFQRPEIAGLLQSAGEEHVLTEEQLGAIETPALIIWGMDDHLLPRETPRFFAQNWGGPIERTYLARCGHMPQHERPGAVVRRVQSFIEAW